MAAAAALADRAAAAEREVSHKTDPHVAIKQSPVDMSDDSDSQVTVRPLKSRKMSKKVAQKLFRYKNKDFDTFTKNCLRMWEIWAN